MNKPETLDYFNPGFVMAIIMALMADACVVIAPGVFIPGVGLIFLALFAFVHYGIGILVGFIIIPQLHHFVPKLLVVLGILLPFPLLGISILIALPLQNKMVESLAVQGALFVGSLVAGPELGIAGELAEGAATGEKAAEGLRAAESVTTAAVDATKAGSQAAERVGGSSAQRARTTLKRGVGRLQDVANDQDENKDREANNVTPEQLGEEPFFFDKFNEDTFATPQTPTAANDDDEKPKENVTIRNDDTIDLAA